MKKEGILIALLVLAMGVIVVMGAYIYNSNMSQKIVSNDVTNNAGSNVKNDEENIEEVAKELIKEYLDIRPYERSNIGPMPYILVELGLETEENITKLCNGIGNKEEYIKSNTKYDEFKNALLKYVSEEYFEIYYSQYKNIDGYVGFCNCAGGTIPIDVEEVKVISEENDIYVFDVKFKDLEMYDHFVNGEAFTDEDYLFNSEITCKIERDKLVIDSFLNTMIILDGNYIIDPSDVSYEFSKDGTVKYETNWVLYEGIYRTVGENEIEINMTKKTEWDEMVPGKTTVTEIDSVEKVIVVDENKIIIENEVDGQIYRAEFIKVKAIEELSEGDLGKDDVLFITSVVNEGDNYSLIGAIYRHDPDNVNNAQINDRWILTDEYRKIIVSKELPCIYGIGEEDTTVGEVFSSVIGMEAEDVSNPTYTNSFKFVFEDGECIKVINCITGGI